MVETTRAGAGGVPRAAVDRGWRQLACAALALLLAAFVAAPATVYLFNNEEVTTPLGAVIGTSWRVVIGVAVAIGLLGLAVRPRGRLALASILLALALLLYLQGNVLVRDYGRFDGGAIDWSRHHGAGTLDAIAWLVLPVAAVAARRRLGRHLPVLAVVIVLLHGAALAGHVLQGRTFRPAPAAGIDAGFAEFSRERNALVMVLDAFAGPAFEQILAGEPAWRTRLDGFTWYRDALAAYPTTLPSVPAMLSGQTTDNGRPVREFMRDSLSRASLPVVLQDRGIATTTITEPVYGEYLAAVPFAGTVSFLDATPGDRRLRDALVVWNVALLRYLPHQLKERVHDGGRWLLRADAAAPGKPQLPYATDAPHCAPSPNQHASRILQEYLVGKASATSRRPTFKFLHLFTSHMPYFLDADGRQLTQERLEQLTESGAVVPQSVSALEQAMAIIERLETLGVLDETLVILAGDHGSHVEMIPGAQEAAHAAGRPSPSLVLPLLLVKPIGATGELAVSEAPVSVTDLAATVADALDVDFPFPGRPLHEVAATERRSRIYRDYTWKHDYWWEEYLPPLTEYRVDGAVRDAGAWSTGRELPAGGPTRQP